MLSEIIAEFDAIEKHVTRKNASTNPSIVQARTNFLILIYNRIIYTWRDNWIKLKSDELEKFRATIVDIRDRTIHCLGILGSQAVVPKDLTKQIVLNSDSGGDNKSEHKPVVPINSDSTQTEDISTNSESTQTQDSIANPNTMEEFEFILKLSQLIRTPYSGDVLGLDAFIAEELAEKLRCAYISDGIPS